MCLKTKLFQLHGQQCIRKLPVSFTALEATAKVKLRTSWTFTVNFVW